MKAEFLLLKIFPGGRPGNCGTGKGPSCSLAKRILRKAWPVTV
jgi:hypothetical protein